MPHATQAVQQHKSAGLPLLAQVAALVGKECVLLSLIQVQPFCVASLRKLVLVQRLLSVWRVTAKQFEYATIANFANSERKICFPLVQVYNTGTIQLYQLT